MTELNILNREDFFSSFLWTFFPRQSFYMAFTVPCCCSLWEKAEGSYSQHSKSASETECWGWVYLLTGR